jgi:cobalt/nickel transport system permease protein
MHIPDGFLSARVAAGYGLLALAGVGAACYRVRLAGERANRALLGVSAAFIFAAQMVNFPVAAGTSGHLLGGALAAALLGLPGAVVVMSSVLFVQCFVFGDGGVLSLGANVFNMALVSPLVGFCCYRLLCGAAPSPTRRVAALAFASFCATAVAAASCAEQLALSDTARLSVVLPAMLGVHALVGIGEAVIAAIVLAAVLRFRPELLEMPENAGASARRGRSLVGYGLGLSPLACDSPDGLSSIAQSLGFQGAERVGLVAAPLAEYTVPGLASGALATILAGSVGALLLFGLCWLLALGLVPRSRLAPEENSAPVAAPSP